MDLHDRVYKYAFHWFCKTKSIHNKKDVSHKKGCTAELGDPNFEILISYLFSI